MSDRWAKTVMNFQIRGYARSTAVVLRVGFPMRIANFGFSRNFQLPLIVGVQWLPRLAAAELAGKNYFLFDMRQSVE
jgi:hypothetical protein